MSEAEKIAASLSKRQRWVPGYEGCYYVNDQGEVYSVARTFDRISKAGQKYSVQVPGRRLVQCLNRNGYPCVSLYANNKGKTREVHRLVCRAFHGEPGQGEEAAHIDGNKTHCSPMNLRWKTRPENHADKRRHGTHLTGERVPNAKLTKEQAVDIFQKSMTGKRNMRGLARYYGVSEKTIRKIRNGEMWADQTKAVREVLQRP